MTGPATRGVLRREYMRKYQTKYLQRPNIRRRLESPEARKRAREYAAQYQLRPGVRKARAAYMREYHRRPDVIRRLKSREALEKKRAAAKRYRASKAAKGHGKKNTKKIRADGARTFGANYVKHRMGRRA